MVDSAPAEPAFGSVSAFDDAASTLQNLNTAGIESGHATAAGVPVAVQEAYLRSMFGNVSATGHQSVRMFPISSTLSSTVPVAFNVLEREVANIVFSDRAATLRLIRTLQSSHCSQSHVTHRWGTDSGRGFKNAFRLLISP